MWWSLGILLGVLLLGGAALQVAIMRNGPAVLDTIDRIAGEDRDACRRGIASTGPDPHQKVVVWGPCQVSEGLADDRPRPVLLFVHGGSWKSGDPEDYGFVGRAFVPEGFVVVLAGYRLVPGGEYPAMVEDTAAAIRWTHENITRHGGDPDRIVLAGHSAGAYNVVMAALERRWLAQAGVPQDAIAGVVGLAGPYDFYPFESDSSQAAFGAAPDPGATQPVTHVTGDAPPVLLVHGEADDLVKPRNSRELARRIEAAGGPVETLFLREANHNDPLLALAAPWRWRRDVAQRIVRFAREAAGTGSLSVSVQAQTR
ncbi:Acetyl esterase/lipase [Erythrobacter litoralis]|uniref:alpha/beta hydrolase n=1 Tax=Erythrobacter litoralis TaxID=39960 RepID=UPI000863B6B2|nr:alpha/beta hydrolase [Erythrobacter litoralis]AOL24989.1 Acetyl esterase/lipase [Erythrobacter litoralis]